MHLATYTLGIKNKKLQMKGKILFALLVSFLMCNSAFSQEDMAGGSFRRTFSDIIDINKVFYKETGLKISESEFLKLIQENPGAYLEREYDEEGNVIRYLYDPNDQNRSGNRTVNGNVPKNAAFPNFIFTTIDKKKIELKDLTGKLVILRFELEMFGFLLKKQEIEELDKKINALSNKEDVEAIIIFGSTEDEVRKGFDLTNSNFELVANGQNFIFKYGINFFPSTLLIDQNGKLIENYSDSNSIILEEYLNR